jgi:hypothetical protein
MKNGLIIFIVSLIFTCWLTDTGAPPRPLPVAIKDINEGSLGVKHKEQIYSDFLYADKAVAKRLLTKVEESDPDKPADYPAFAAK